MKVSATARFLVRNIVLGNTTYQECATKRPDLKEQIDYYIEQQGIDIDKTV